jgi:hypothetical protein
MRFVAHIWDPVQPEADVEETMRVVVERALDGIDKLPWLFHGGRSHGQER